MTVGDKRGPKAKRGRQAPAPLQPRAQKGQRGAPPPVPRARPPAEPLSGYPTISLRYADRSYDGAWGWPTDGGETGQPPGGGEAQQVLDNLFEVSRTTWAELATQQTGPSHKRRPKHHSEQIGDLCKEAQDRIAGLRLDETFGDEVFRFRFDGTARLWGFKLEATFFALWWDPAHKVRPA